MVQLLTHRYFKLIAFHSLLRSLVTLFQGSFFVNLESAITSYPLSPSRPAFSLSLSSSFLLPNVDSEEKKQAGRKSSGDKFFGGKKFLNKFWTRCDFLYSQDWFGLHQSSFLSLHSWTGQGLFIWTRTDVRVKRIEEKERKRSEGGVHEWSKVKDPSLGSSEATIEPRTFFPSPSKSYSSSLFFFISFSLTLLSSEMMIIFSFQSCSCRKEQELTRKRERRRRRERTSERRREVEKRDTWTSPEWSPGKSNGLLFRKTGLCNTRKRLVCPQLTSLFLLSFSPLIFLVLPPPLPFERTTLTGVLKPFQLHNLPATSKEKKIGRRMGEEMVQVRSDPPSLSNVSLSQKSVCMYHLSCHIHLTWRLVR